MNRYDKILGSLLAGAVGDAMGAPTETRTTSQIKEKFGGLVTTMYKPSEDVFAHGFDAGSVTDDFSLAYYTAKAIVANKGVVDNKTAEKALLDWSETPYFQMVGPTTQGSVNKIKGIVSTFNGFTPFNDNGKGSNGSAMKIGPVGLVSGGNVDKAIKDAITIILPTHNNTTSLAGGCAVAAAVSKALEDNVTIDEVIEAGLKGATAGEEYGKKYGKYLANPSVYKRIKLAVEIGRKYHGDMEAIMQELTDIIGSGLSAAEAVPCAFGILAGLDGDAEKCIIAGVNIGSDTDTVATIVGAISGALNGYENPEYLQLIKEVNNMDLVQLAHEILEVSCNG